MNKQEESLLQKEGISKGGLNFIQDMDLPLMIFIAGSLGFVLPIASTAAFHDS